MRRRSQRFRRTALADRSRSNPDAVRKTRLIQSARSRYPKRGRRCCTVASDLTSAISDWFFERIFDSARAS
jgi:hypothetical protein